MDYVETLRLFRSVVEAGSFTRAADTLGVTTPVVSRAISSLEQRLGSRLFHRTTRQISLTETAERFYERCTKILDDLEALEAETLKETREPTGVLRLVAHTTATVYRLVPLLASFKRRYPKVSLEVTLVERPIDLVADGYDLGIVVPYMLTSDTTVTRLLEWVPQIVVASPAYLETHRTPTTPADLEEHTFVTMSPSFRKPTLTFKVDGNEMTVPMKFDVASNNPAFNSEMVLEGFGLGVLPAVLVHDELASGRLVRVLDEFELAEGGIEIRLAYVTKTLMPAKVRAFIDHATSFYESGTQP
ncbi:LysR family transcriptional regulator [Paraburkholderia phytofirmans]|uniref:LysR family transcriptional regulator n=1 Tax=Paraburkholderia phytofirmans OLGA172 TaxID=1417228 RepID=A0A167WCY5_9BURK|nr:LysR family transcriptional regulator [Paraburkholderia phytofirmans]ANB75823.1 LysR family transcriptional regulator [Paraburkholderia phytofirmans OLGA172]